MKDDRSAAGQKEAEHADVRVQMTSKIWGTMPAALALSIPICAIIGNGGVAVPIAAMLAAGVGTAAIWLRGGAPTGGAPTGAALPAAASAKHIQELEERLANLEAITNFEHKLLDVKYPGAAPVPVASPFSFETPLSAPAREAVQRPMPTAPMPVDAGHEEMSRGGARPIAS